MLHGSIMLKTAVRETGCEFTGNFLLRIGSYHDLLRAGKCIFNYIKVMTSCKTVSSQRMAVLRTVRLYVIRESSLGQYRCLFTRCQIQPNRSVFKHVLSSELYVPVNLRPQQVVQSVSCLRCNLTDS
jgi:hypothetical protein